MHRKASGKMLFYAVPAAGAMSTAAAALDNDFGGYRSGFCELVRKARDIHIGSGTTPEPPTDMPTLRQ